MAIEFEKKKEYKQIESEEEYNKELKWFQEEIKFKFSEAMTNPKKAYDHFMEVIDRAEGIGLFEKEYCDSIRKKLIKGIHNKDLKEKIRQYLQKRGLLK